MDHKGIAGRVAAFGACVMASLLCASVSRAADQALIEAAKKEGTRTWYTTLIVDQFVRPAAAAFEKKYGVKVNYVNYKGQAQAITDVIGRTLDVGMGDMTGALPLIQSGKIRAIGVSGATRHPGLPNVPAIRETFPEYENYAWTSFFVRAETPSDAHGKLVSAMQTAMRSPEMKRYFEVNGSDPMTDFGPERMAEHLRLEIARFRRVAEAAGIKPE
jgi:tripartite-type tricarboxylate transporter receptor subunit TctC